MTGTHQSGQTLVESLAALWLLILVFFCIYYLFRSGLDKIRSLDTVYALARSQEVRPNYTRFMARSPFIMEQCFGRLGFPVVQGLGGTGPGVKEVGLFFLPNFGPLQFIPHRSLMRVAEPEADYLDKSYPTAATDDGGPGLTAKLGAELLALETLARAPSALDLPTDAGEDAIATIEAGKP